MLESVPTVGRIVHFYDRIGALATPAIITRVVSATLVNLTAFPDMTTLLMSYSSVPRIDTHHGEGPYWEWPPRT